MQLSNILLQERQGKMNFREHSLVCLILMCSLYGLVRGQSCSHSDWTHSFDWEGLSRCNSGVLRGLSRNKRDLNDGIFRLEGAECCPPTFPWKGSQMQTIVSDWYYSLDHNNAWALCQPGHFLAGLWRRSPRTWVLEWGDHRLAQIDEGICTRPASHPPYYGDCYNEDISTCFDNANLCGCRENYFVTGLFRGDCEQLHCLDQLRCCQMTNGSETLDELSKVKSRVMDITMNSMVKLASNLGYRPIQGCRLPNWGEDFVRRGDTWYSYNESRCEGYRSNGLEMAYQDWGFGLKNIEFGRSLIEDLQPESVDHGTITNRALRDVEESVTREETVTQSVTHTKTSSWKHAHELGIDLNFIFASIKYKFTYENSQASTESSSAESSRSFKVTEHTAVPPNSTVKWRLMLHKSRTTIPYTATVVVKFSTEIRGIMSYGGGYNGPYPNFHYQLRGRDDLPRFQYRFGNSQTPFYTALKQESDRNQHPWMWTDMKMKHPSAQNVINYLTNDNLYVFTLTGQLEAVQGKSVQIEWDNVRHLTKRAVDSPLATTTVEAPTNFKHLYHVAKATAADLPAARPPPPEVKIEVPDLPDLQSAPAQED